MRKALFVLVFAVGFAGAYLKHKPTLTYMTGLVEAAISRQGSVASATMVRLPVHPHRQEHSLSCELASLKMALSGVGVNVEESELIRSLRFDPTPKQGGVWGDPYEGFVGDINGKMSATGYGVYWDPVAQVGLRYRRTEVLRNAQLSDLVSHINQGRPVVVWGFYGSGTRNNWMTPAGRAISAVHGEHARVLIGYAGPAHSPEKLILLDPIYGELHWDTAGFLENWAALENGAVAVYHYPRWVRTPEDGTVWEISADASVRQALHLDWDQFIAQGGVGEGIAYVHPAWLAGLPEGQPITSLQ